MAGWMMGGAGRGALVLDTAMNVRPEGPVRLVRNFWDSGLMARACTVAMTVAVVVDVVVDVIVIAVAVAIAIAVDAIAIAIAIATTTTAHPAITATTVHPTTTTTANAILMLLLHRLHCHTLPRSIGKDGSAESHGNASA